MAHDYASLPPNLPVPQDDGAARHLDGLELPDLSLPLAGGGELRLHEAAAGTLVAFIYPRTGTPGEPLAPGWDDIPGARGCTPQSCAFRDSYGDLARLGASVVGISAMEIAAQRAFAEREQLPYPLANDSDLTLGRELRLPTFEVEGVTLLKRLTFVARAGRIEKVFYPVFPPDRNAADVVEWLSGAPA
ncbi:MAG TPA: peroxiredoxin [Thermoleophilaceae bacterium]|nr:peroxiredoxin [Thermoleophilaceae bacterium]